MKRSARITWVAKVATPQRSPYKTVAFYGLGSPWADVAAAGVTADILLDWGYTNLDPKRKGSRSVVSTPTGFTEVVSHGVRKGHKFTVSFVKEDRVSNAADDYVAMTALLDHLEAGEVVYYPDWESHPTEFVTAVAENIKPPRRIDVLDLWRFEFDLISLPQAQAPTTIPAVV